MSKVNPKIDLVFKKLFGAEENKDLLLSLINAILPAHQQITELVLKNPYNISDYAEGKLSILDIKAQDENGVQYDIEMQIKGTGFYGKRILYYWAKMFGSQLDYLTEEEKKKRSKKDYPDLSKCIVISLMDFIFFKDEKYNRCYMLKDRDSNETHIDLDYLDLYFIELPKFDTGLKFVQSTLERWIAFLNIAQNYTRGNLPKELAEITEIRKASAALDVMYFDEQERQYYESQQKFFLDESARMREVTDKMKEAEKALAEKASQLVEAEKMNAQKEKALAEKASQLVEAEKMNAQKEKALAEKASQLVETESQLAQKEKALAEAEKMTAETEKALAEAEKITAQTEKALAEAEKMNAQKGKALAEAEKITAQTEKALAEAEKMTAETEKALAEAVDAEQKSKIEFAKKLLKRNFAVQDIAEDTGLTIAQIQEIYNKIKK